MSNNQLRRPIGVQFSLLAPDREAAVEFYCRTLGLFFYENGGLVFRDAPSFSIGLLKPESIAGRSAIGKQAGDEPLLCIDVEDCGAFERRLREAGVQLDGEMIVTPYLRQLTCIDPFGNKIALYEATAEIWQMNNPIEDR